jgi:hypothetical protein
MLRVMPEIRGRGAGEGRHNPKGAVNAAAARYRWSYFPGEPDALKGACPVREEVVGNVPQGNALATYFMKVMWGGVGGTYVALETSHRDGTRDAPLEGDLYGNGVPIVVVRVMSHQGVEESSIQGEGAQVVR